MPHPLTLLENPISKEKFKKMAKSLVTDFWEKKMRLEAAPLPSLAYFRPAFHSLQKPHPILWSPGANPHEVSKAVVQLKMLSGRYRTAMLFRHWKTGQSGCCPAPGCHELETLEHILLFCQYYDETRNKLQRLWTSTGNLDVLQPVVDALNGPPLDLV